MNTNFEEFQKSISKELYTIKDRVKNLIGDAHWGEEGRYKESVLKNVVSRFLPSNLSIGSGFIITKDYKNGRTIRSSQIDIIVYDNTYPLLFKEGDFIITSPENVRAIVEVKTAIRSGDISEIITKATQNAKIAPFSTFNGIFAYEKRGLNLRTNLNQNLRNALISSNGVVNHICLGENIFIKFWGVGEKQEDKLDRIYSFYEIDDLAFSYFISNMIESVVPDKVFDKSWFLYPIRNQFGKEFYIVRDLKLSNEVNRTHI
ncbi:DUF6602 domain-containing protein [Oceanobacillus sp. M65]|uniref:DUF6602 domain-containing protein n=1 Tax=Oceanobacillus sp. M65 TaxID=3457435 RepID=UPI003FCECF3E